MDPLTSRGAQKACSSWFDWIWFENNSVRNESIQLGSEKNQIQFGSKLFQIELELSLAQFETLLSSSKSCLNFELVMFKTDSNRTESNSISSFQFETQFQFQTNSVRNWFELELELEPVKFDLVWFVWSPKFGHERGWVHRVYYFG